MSYCGILFPVHRSSQQRGEYEQQGDPGVGKCLNATNVSNWRSPISFFPAKALVLQSQLFRILLLDLEYHKLAVMILLFCQVDV